MNAEPINPTRVGQTALILISLFIGTSKGLSQGSFVNLDFEHPFIPLIRGGDFMVPIEDGLPGWTGYIGGNQVNRVIFDTVTLGGAAISLQDQNGFFQPFQGDYSVYLNSSFGTTLPKVTSAIAQTGEIPANAQSLTLFASPINLFNITFDGQVLPLSTISTTDRYVVLGADISAFAGRTGELRFQGDGMLDNIQFSPLPVPEPGTWTLLGLGLLAGFARWQVSRRK